jgi:hypothetical protein
LGTQYSWSNDSCKVHNSVDWGCASIPGADDWKGFGLKWRLVGLVRGLSQQASTKFIQKMHGPFTRSKSPERCDMIQTPNLSVCCPSKGARLGRQRLHLGISTTSGCIAAHQVSSTTRNTSECNPHVDHGTSALERKLPSERLAVIHMYREWAHI